MKKTIIIKTIILLFTLVLTNCRDEDKTFFQDGIEFKGGYLITVDYPNNNLSLSDLENSNFEVTLEAHDFTSDSSQLKNVQIFASLNGDTENENMLLEVPASMFSTNDKGYPEKTIISSANDVIGLLSLDTNNLSNSDYIHYRCVLNLLDGTSYSENDINPDLVGETNFHSPFFYDANFTE